MYASPGHNELTHWSLAKVVNFAVGNFLYFVFYENCCMLVQISEKHVWEGPTDNKALVKVA